jgi:hypothetical protein
MVGPRPPTDPTADLAPTADLTPTADPDHRRTTR